MEYVALAIVHVFENIPRWLDAALAVVGAASAITALTPAPGDDRFLGKLRRALEIVALNIGHASPAPPPTRR